MPLPSPGGWKRTCKYVNQLNYILCILLSKNTCEKYKMTSPQVSSIFGATWRTTRLVGNECERPSGAGARLESIFNYKYNKIYNNIIITNHKSAAHHDSCSGSRRTNGGRRIALFTFLSGCITFDVCSRRPLRIIYYHLKLVRKLHVLFFMTLIFIVVFISTQRSRAPCTLCLSCTLP